MTVWGVSGYQSDTPKRHGEPIPRGDSDVAAGTSGDHERRDRKVGQRHGGGHREEHEDKKGHEGGARQGKK